VNRPARHPLLEPAIVAEIERAASEHLGRPWRSQGFTSVDERSSHPAGVFHGRPIAVFAKLGPDREQFAAELTGLRLLTQQARIATPVPVADGLIGLPDGALLLSEALPERLPAARQPSDWRSMGRVLATLHQVKHAKFGLDQNGFFGPLPQDNRPAPTWPQFYRERRILPLLRAATDSGHLPADLAAGVARIAERLPALCGPDPQPSLLHGDAQQNNFISTPAGAVVIDACPYFGHPEIDLAQVDFFEPVPASLFEAYRDIVPISPGFAHRRELWRLATYLAVISVDARTPFGRQQLARLAGAIRRYG
jgi:fructosamine-3-kinase